MSCSIVHMVLQVSCDLKDFRSKGELLNTGQLFCKKFRNAPALVLLAAIKEFILNCCLFATYLLLHKANSLRITRKTVA